VIKFHEYRGPPGTQRNSQPQPELRLNVDGAAASSLPYNIMLQQQQILLQWQLQQQLQQQNRTFVVPASQENACSDTKASVLQVSSTVPSTTSSGFKFAPTVTTMATAIVTSIMPSRPTRLEDMKVADLKEACRRLNLSRSGPKPVLIERLQPHAADILNQPDASHTSAVELPSAASEKTVEHIARGVTPQPLVPMDVDLSCKSEPSTTQCSVLTPPGQYAVVPGCQGMTALKPGFQSNMTVGSSHIAIPSTVDVCNGRIILPSSSDQHLSAIVAPAILPQPVMLPPATVVNTAFGSQQTLVRVPGSHIIQMMPPVDIKNAGNGLPNPSVQGLSRMPHVLLIRPPDSTVHSKPLNNIVAPPNASVLTRIPDKIASEVCKPNGVTVTSSSNGVMPPVFVFQKSPMSTSGVEDTHTDVASVSERLPLSPEQLVIRQQQHIMQLERHLHQSQQELARAQQEARLRQLTSLDEASRSTSLFWRRPLNGSASISLSNVNVDMPSSHIIRTPGVVTTVASAVNRYH